jgi:8-oxo-dGTP pyrophosphatase MutT (NUDIX family)
MITHHDLQRALTLPEFEAQAAQWEMAPRPRTRLPHWEGVPVKQAGVLALIYPAAGLHLVLTLRQASLRGHSGQISFPGGKRDPEDPSFTATALRETEEELGIPAQDITIVGTLATFYIPPSHYDVHPSVGVLEHAPTFHPNPAEVAAVIPFPLVDLFDPAVKQVEHRDFNGMTIRVPFYNIQGHKVWGATAVMLSELEHRLRVATQ